MIEWNVLCCVLKIPFSLRCFTVLFLDYMQMYLMLDALADGGVWAGIPKELSIKLIAHTMLVRSGSIYLWLQAITRTAMLSSVQHQLSLCALLACRVRQGWC